MLKEEELAELERALRAATPAPWTRFRVLRESGWVYAVIPADRDGGVAESLSDADSAAIAALRNLAPALLEEIRAARAWRKEAERLLEEALMYIDGRDEFGHQIRAFLGE